MFCPERLAQKLAGYTLTQNQNWERQRPAKETTHERTLSYCAWNAGKLSVRLVADAPSSDFV